MFDELILGKIRFLYGNIKKQSTTALTFYNSQLPIDFEDKYKFLKGKPASFNIHDFHQVGMSDPYALEPSGGKFTIPKLSKNLVYPIDRYC